MDDREGQFEKLNPHLPKNKVLHTFLLDENNNVILVGNPLHNKKIEKMFYKIVEENWVNRNNFLLKIKILLMRNFSIKR